MTAGLDARSWRLARPDGTTVYELNEPRMLPKELEGRSAIESVRLCAADRDLA
ncbi:MAG: class I SAM-dependent methyltransferase [Mycobacterium sp.]|nr:class I SAM-dependent methyltransferase [Mycobacterium sp.]